MSAEQKTKKRRMALVITASTAGTAFEGYDYFLFGALATILSAKFFSGVDETSAFIFTLLTFAVGFITRPLGAIVFGRVGDRIGRKQVFLIAIALMGVATVAIGLLPTFEQVGIAAPILLLTCRLLQGFALGGEYGGAVIYVAEHSSHERRGFNTSWIQTTGALGLISALSVILIVRRLMGEEAFQDWGWRIPFLLSVFLLIGTVWLRLKLAESPVFEKIQEEGGVSENPVRESFLEWRNLKIILLALFGLVMATGVMFYAGQFFVQYYLERISKVSPDVVNGLIVASVALSAPLFVVFGALSDRIGRKPVMLAGMAVMVLAYFPAFSALSKAANPALVQAEQTHPVSIHAARGSCSLQFDPLNLREYSKPCDVARRALSGLGVNYALKLDAAQGASELRVGDVSRIDLERAQIDAEVLQDELKAALSAAGYPETANDDEVNYLQIVGIIVLFVVCIAAISGPQAAALAELFPARIRYTALSFPYHVGLGWFGGFMPAIAFTIIAQTGNTMSGLWYPFVVTLTALVIAVLFLPETKHRDLV